MDEEKLKQISKQQKTWTECIYYRPIWYNPNRCRNTNEVCLVLVGEYCPYHTIEKEIE